MNKHYLDFKLLYTCNPRKNKGCTKWGCAHYYEGRNICSHTSKYKYAKKTPLNFIKKIINKIRGTYKYD